MERDNKKMNRVDAICTPEFGEDNISLPQRDTFSYSSITLYKQCPYKFKLSKIDGLKTIFDANPSNALVIGRAFHKGIETNAETAISEYYQTYSLVDDKHIEEAIKLEHIINEANTLLPNGLHEVEINYKNYRGFIDLLVEVGDNTYDMYDFKYSNNIERYLESEQLHVYKYYFEKAGMGEIRNMYYLFAPKTQIRLKKSETLEQFRMRLCDTLADKHCQVVQVDYKPDKVKEFILDAETCFNASDFPKNETRLCGWCEFEEYCKKGVDYMILPENKRTERSESTQKKIYVYGAPFTGKSYLANQFPNVLFLSTDGNYKNFPNGIPPAVDIRDIVTVDGRLTKRTYAWEVFKETVEELEKGNNSFETIVLDLVEGVYELCRQWVFVKHGIQHESDSGYGKGWDLVRTEFLSTLKRFMSLDYENIILISHEDVSKDISKRGGDKITAVKPNITDKLANALAGYVDVVIRTTVNGSSYELSFKNDEFTFGGGRLAVTNINNLPSSYETIKTIYSNLNKE